jgi:hypothetical protein
MKRTVMTRTNAIIWLAGLLEGEGNFHYNGKSQVIKLGMTDEDIVHRAALIVTMITGRPCKVACRLPGKNSVQLWYLIQPCGENARLVMRAVVQYMGFRRRGQIWRSLNKYDHLKHKVDLVALLKIKELAP